MSDIPEEIASDALARVQEFAGEIVPDGVAEAAELAQLGPQGVQRLQTTHHVAIKVPVPRNLKALSQAVLVEARLLGPRAYYNWTAKGKLVEGATVKLALALARNWGNCHLECDVVEMDDEYYLFKAVFVDLETGFTVPRLFRQRRKIDMGKKMEKDPERVADIAFQIGQSKDLRNAIINGLPGWLVDAAMAAAKREAGKELSPAAVGKLIDVFRRKHGVTVEDLERKVGCGLDDLTGEQFAMLKGLLNALQSGDTTVDNEFWQPDEGEGQDQGDDRQPGLDLNDVEPDGK